MSPIISRWNSYMLTWRLPMVIWQLAFFVVPLCFMVILSFWLVKNYRMEPAFVSVNWTKMYSRDYFWDAYWYTLGLACVSTITTSVIAIPAAFALAFRTSENVRRWMIFFLIIPFFTSYIVRAYAWQVIIAKQGVVNGLFALVGLGPYTILNTWLGTIIGYLTLTLPLVIILQTISLANVDRSLIEAAYNLGCNRIRTIFVVIMPLAKVG